MNQDLVDLAGLLLSSWFLGFGMGLIITTFRKFTDKL